MVRTRKRAASIALSRSFKKRRTSSRRNRRSYQARSRRRRIYRRRRPSTRRINSRALTVPRRLGYGATPQVLLMRMPYCTTMKLTQSAGVGDAHTFRLNSPYDPDQTGTGTSAFNYTEYCTSTKYQKYCVLGASYIVSGLYNTDGINSGAFGVRVYPAYLSSTTDRTWQSDMTAANYANYKCASMTDGRVQCSGLMNRERPFGRISGYANVPRQFGYTKAVWHSKKENLQGSYNGNPSDVLRLDVVTLLVEGSDTFSIEISVTIVYFLMLYDHSDIGTAQIPG